MFTTKRQPVKMWRYAFRVNGGIFTAVASNVDEAIVEVMRLYHCAEDGDIVTIKRDAEREKIEPYNKREHIVMRLIRDED